MEKSRSNKDLHVTNQSAYSASSQANEMLPGPREKAAANVYQFNYLQEELEKQSHDTQKLAKVKGVPKSFKTFGSSTLDESIKGEKD